MPSNYLICCPLLLPPSIIPSIRVFSNESAPPSGDQSTGVSASASVLPMNIQDWLSLGWTGCISLLSKGLSRVFSNTTVQKHQFHDNLEMSISHMKKIRSEELTNLAKTWAACTKRSIWPPVYLSIISTVWLLTVKKWLETLRLLCRIKCIWGASGFVGLIDPSLLQISSLFQFNQDQGDDVCINLSKPQQLVLTHFVLSSANVTLLLQ